MNTILGTLCILALSSRPPVQNGQDGGQEQNDKIATAARSAEQDLAASIAELDRLRTQITGEKLPLTQELSTLEEKVTELRREHERVSRLVDAGSLDAAGIKTETKAREDELTYITNLLDEYARSFESKVNVSELQQCGAAIAAAKEAIENPALSMTEKFDRQVGFAELSLARLFEAIGGMRFPGTGVDLQGIVAEGQYALIGPVALFCASGGPAGLVVPQIGSTQPLIRPLEGKAQAGIAALVTSGEGFLPLDPSRGGALKALVQKTNLVHIFEKGGPIMWPLLAASVLALATVLERLFFLFRERMKRDPKALDAFFAAVTKGELDEAVRVSNGTKFFVVRALGYALGHREQSLANALVYAQAQELKRFRRGIPVLDTVITLAPLLGLLGTVTGMMGSFSLIGGELSAPGAITGGIAEALIATAFGLGIAITALLPFNLLNSKLDVARHEIESAATQLELIVHPAPVQAALPDAFLSPRRDARDHAHAHPRNDQDRETRRRREAIRRRMEELRSELEEHELEIQGLEDNVVRVQGKE